MVGNSVPVRPAGRAVAKDRPGQLPMPIPGLVSPDHSPDPSVSLYTVPHTCRCLACLLWEQGREGGRSWSPGNWLGQCVSEGGWVASSFSSIPAVSKPR